jgi:ubiquitin carboxyl-terminal hydrolase 22/27/51
LSWQPVVVGTRSRIAATEEDLTMAHCLETYTALETLSEPYTCEKCGGPRLSSKQLTIHRLPEVLVLHLKRFDARKGRKIERFVKFPTEGLDMSPYLYSSRAEAELFARAAAAAAPSAGASSARIVGTTTVLATN